MANPERGEVELVADTASYTLVLSMNAICEMQTRTGKTYGQLLLAMRGLDFVALRDLLWTTLKPRHAKTFTKVEQVGDLIDSYGPGGVEAVIKALTELFTLNAAKTVEGEANPPTAQT